MSGLEQITDAEVYRMAIADRLIDLHVAMPCKVTGYNKDKQTVTVEPALYRSLPDGSGNFTVEPLPKLADVPVCFPRSSQFGVTFPLVAGDTGLLVFSERNIGSWRTSAAAGDPGDQGTHTLDGAVFIPGLFPDVSPVVNTSATNMVIGSDTNGPSRIEITPSSGGNLGAGATKGIARNGDPVTSTADFVTWATAVKAQIVVGGGGDVGLPPTHIADISGASSKWKAVD